MRREEICCCCYYRKEVDVTWCVCV